MFTLNFKSHSHVTPMIFCNDKRFKYFYIKSTTFVTLHCFKKKKKIQYISQIKCFKIQQSNVSS